MINNYIEDLDAFISASPAISEISIIRRDIRDTGLEIIALYRYQLKFKDGSMMDITERLVEERNHLNITKYRYHWQSSNGALIKRWDNAPHHSELDTFPDHIHVGTDDNVECFNKVNVLDILTTIIGSLNLDDQK